MCRDILIKRMMTENHEQWVRTGLGEQGTVERGDAGTAYLSSPRSPVPPFQFCMAKPRFVHEGR